MQLYIVFYNVFMFCEVEITIICSIIYVVIKKMQFATFVLT